MLLYSALARSVRYAQNNYEGAIRDFDEALKLEPKDVLTLVARAQAYFGKAEYDKAVADCAEAIRLDPTEARAFVSRGTAPAPRRIMRARSAISMRP